MSGLYYTLFSASVTGTKVEVSPSPVSIGAYHILNNAAAISYVQCFYLAVGDVTVGSTTPDVALALPASGGAALLIKGGWLTKGPLTIAVTTTRTGSTTATADVTFWRAR